VDDPGRHGAGTVRGVLPRRRERSEGTSEHCVEARRLPGKPDDAIAVAEVDGLARGTGIQRVDEQLQGPVEPKADLPRRRAGRPARRALPARWSNASWPVSRVLVDGCARGASGLAPAADGLEDLAHLWCARCHAGQSSRAL
jgi:hypothetical protein